MLAYIVGLLFHLFYQDILAFHMPFLPPFLIVNASNNNITPISTTITVRLYFAHGEFLTSSASL